MNRFPKCKVKKVSLVGLARTKVAIIHRILCDPLKDVEDIEEINNALKRIQYKLRSTGLFNGVSIEVDECEEDESGKVNLHIKATFRECSPVSFKGATHARVRGGYADPDAEFSAGLVNILGRGEKLSAGVKLASDWSANVDRSFFLNIHCPLLLSEGNQSLDIDFQRENYTYDQSLFKAISNGGEIKYRRGNHVIGYEGSWREAIALTDSSHEIRRQCGHTFKSAIKHTYTRDNRDNPFTPRAGYAYRISNEIAGVGGNVFFTKTEASLQHNIPVFAKSSFNLLFKAGVMFPWNDDSTRVIDRFSLGGPIGMRGFSRNSLGAKSPKKFGYREDYLGGDFFATASAHFSFPIPIKDFPDWINGHVFVNAGNIASLSSTKTGAAQLRNFVEKMRVSTGAGILLRTVFGRIELNVSLPIKKDVSDLTDVVQLGLCVQFL